MSTDGLEDSGLFADVSSKLGECRRVWSRFDGEKEYWIAFFVEVFGICHDGNLDGWYGGEGDEMMFVG